MIPGIYNYCHRRCERCAFNERCFLYRENQEEARRHGERGAVEEIQANLQRTIDLIRACGEGGEVDLEQVFRDADAEGIEVEKGSQDGVATIEHDSLYLRSKSCAAAAH